MTYCILVKYCSLRKLWPETYSLYYKRQVGECPWGGGKHSAPETYPWWNQKERKRIGKDLTLWLMVVSHHVSVPFKVLSAPVKTKSFTCWESLMWASYLLTRKLSDLGYKLITNDCRETWQGTNSCIKFFKGQTGLQISQLGHFSGNGKRGTCL